MLANASATYNWWLTPAVALGLQIFLLETRLEHAARRGGKLLFRFPILFRTLILLAPAVLGYYTWQDWAGEEWWIKAGAIAMILWFLASWPPVIAISSSGIERHFWWRPRIFIPWNEVVSLEDHQNGDREVIGQNATIFISRFQCDPVRLNHELRARSRIPDFHRPEQVTGLHLNR